MADRQMQEKTEGRIKNLLAVGLVVCMAAVLCITSVAIFQSPPRVSTTTAGNYSANLMQGGRVLEQDDYLFYTPLQDGGVFRVNIGDFSNPVQIASTGGGNLQYEQGSYFFSEQDALILTDVDGDSRQTVLDYAKNPLVVGDRVYYINREGFLARYSKWDQNNKVFEIQPAGQVVVYASNIYYIAQDGYIHRAAFYGSEDRVFIQRKAESFLIDGSYIFFLSEGKAYSATMDAENMLVVELVAADRFLVNAGYIIFNNEQGCWWGYLNNLVNSEDHQLPQVSDQQAACFQMGEDCFYIFMQDGTILKLQLSTGQTTVVVA